MIVYARSAGSANLEHASRALLSILPSGHETRLLEKVRRFLLPQGGKRLSALEQQGVISLLEQRKGRRASGHRRVLQ